MSPSLLVLALLLAVGSAGLAGLSARADDEPEYELRMSGPIDVDVGRRGSASLTVVPAAGKSIYRHAPITVRLSVEPKAGLKLLRRRFGRPDAADPRADAPRFDLLFDAEQPGSYELVATTRFWICGKRTCRPVHDTARVRVEVAGKDAGP